MAADWQTVSFRDAFSINPSIGLEVGAAYPFVEMADISPGTRDVLATQSREYTGGGSKFSAGDTLLARITPCLENGKICRYSGRSGAVAHGSTEFIVVRGRNDITDDAFAYYTTSSQEFRAFAISQMTGSSGRQRVPTESLRNWFVRLPPLPEQKRIAHILGTLDDKIDLNRRMNATLEGISRAIFKSWFVDFDPVRQKAAGKQPVRMDAQTAALFPDSFEDSEIGEVPTGWEVTPLPQVVEVNPARGLKKGETALYLDMANAPITGHTPDELISRPFGSGTRFMNGDTLMARITPCLENGKTAFIDCLQPDEVAWGSTEFIVLRPYPPLPPEFAYCLVRDDGFREFAIQSMTGSSGRQRVPAESLDHFRLARPPEGLGQAFADRIQPHFQRIRAAANESRTLAALRDTLLPKLLSGEVRVPEAEEAVTEAVR